MAAEPPQSPVTEGVRSLEVRWIFPGQLDTAVVGWFGRFPAAVESREDTYLLDPQWRGLSVKVRGGGALEVKVYRGSQGILDLAGRARGRMESWQKWSFPFSPPRQDSAGRRAGDRYARGGESAGSHGPARRSRRAPLGWAASRGARWSSPRSARAGRTGGPWASRQPVPPICSAASSRPPPRWCSPRPCPVAWNPARMNPGPTRSGCACGRVPRVTPTPEGCPAAPFATSNGNARGRHYRLVLRGEMGEPFSFPFEGMQMDRVASTTVLTRRVIDQTHLHGLIQRTQARRRSR